MIYLEYFRKSVVDIWTNIIIGLLVIIYTVSGGTKAVNYTQKYQMGIILIGLIIVFVTVINLFPENISFKKAIEIASTNSKMEILNFSFDFENRYTVWSGIIGGTFLMMSYFGTDQSLLGYLYYRFYPYVGRSKRAYGYLV